MSPSRPALIAALCLVALTGCSASAAEPPPTITPTPTAPAAYPLTIDNCGTEVTFITPPERVLAIKSTSIEMLLALGLEDRIVGTAFSDGPAAQQWADRAEQLPVIADRVPSQEATLNIEPDLVYAGWESNVTADGAGEREVLASFGVNTYVSPAACQHEDYQPKPLTFEHVFDDIREMGAIFDVPGRADALVASLRTELAGLEPDGRGLTALWYSSGRDIPFVGGAIGAPQMMMDAAGLSNIAADIDATWSSLSWEVVVDRNPDVIIIVESMTNTRETKIGVLESHPATALLPAVQERRYIVIPFASAEAGVRNVEAVASILAQLDELDLP